MFPLPPAQRSPAARPRAAVAIDPKVGDEGAADSPSRFAPAGLERKDRNPTASHWTNPGGLPRKKSRSCLHNDQRRRRAIPGRHILLPLAKVHPPMARKAGREVYMLPGASEPGVSDLRRTNGPDISGGWLWLLPARGPLREIVLGPKASSRQRNAHLRMLDQRLMRSSGSWKNGKSSRRRARRAQKSQRRPATVSAKRFERSNLHLFCLNLRFSILSAPRWRQRTGRENENR